MITTTSYQSMNRGDEVYATLECNGHVLTQVCATQFGSLDEIVGYVYATAGLFAGLARLTVRNRTQGWSTVLPLARKGRRPLVA